MCHSCATDKFLDVPLRIRLVLLRGVLRRFFLILFRPQYVRAGVARRKGACARCGACCRLAMSRCFALSHQADGSSHCAIYNKVRMPNCIQFPIDERDIAERNLIMPADVPCGYFF